MENGKHQLLLPPASLETNKEDHEEAKIDAFLANDAKDICEEGKSACFRVDLGRGIFLVLIHRNPHEAEVHIGEDGAACLLEEAISSSICRR